MNTPFPCVCGTSTCFRNIRGFRHVNDDDRQRLWHNATPAIRSAACQSLVASALGSMDRSTIAVDNVGLIRASDDVASGTVLFPVQRWSVQGSRMVLDDAHIRHSCDPNVFLVLGKLVAARVIPAGEEIRLNLNLTYYRLPTPFACTCGARDCVETVAGFAEVPLEAKHRLMIFVDPDVRVLATKDGYRLTSDSALVSIKDNGDMGQTTFAAIAIRKGTRFFRSTGVVIPFPTVYTILLAPGRNLLFAGGAHCLAHSCDPNVQVMVEPHGNSFDLVALRDIQEGEMVSFNYLTTEWDMNVPFPCLCGATACYHMIRGFKHLSDTERTQLAPLATGAVKELAGLHSQIQLPSTLVPTQQRMIAATTTIPRGTCLFECANMELHPTHLTTGQFLVKHSLSSNTVFVEGRLISLTNIGEGEVLTVNMCYMVYDMTKLFPDTYVPENRGFKYLDEAVKQYDLYLCEPPVRAQAMRDGWIVVPTNPILTVRPNGDMGQTAYAVEAIPSGTLLFHTANKGLIVPYPTMYTICVGEKRHLLFGDAAECIAHSCDPNVHVVVRSDETLEFRTCKDVEKGGMMSFCYSTTEWMMNSTFPCLCGSEFCGKYIRGFKNLTDADRQRLWPLTSDYIRGLANGSK